MAPEWSLNTRFPLLKPHMEQALLGLIPSFSDSILLFTTWLQSQKFRFKFPCSVTGCLPGGGAAYVKSSYVKVAQFCTLTTVTAPLSPQWSPWYIGIHKYKPCWHASPELCMPANLAKHLISPVSCHTMGIRSLLSGRVVQKWSLLIGLERKLALCLQVGLGVLIIYCNARCKTYCAFPCCIVHSA